VISFPNLEEEARRRALAEARRLALQCPKDEWLLYLSQGHAEKYGCSQADFRRMIEAVIEEREKATRAAQIVQKEGEQKAERERSRQERKAARKERERREEEQRRERERKEAARRENVIQTILELPPGEREGPLKIEAERRGVDYDTLATEFADRLAAELARAREGDIEPWGEPVDTRALLDALTTQIRRYVVFHQKEALPMVALWVGFAWCHEIATHSPFLVFQAPDRNTAKTTTSKVVGRLAPRGQVIVEPTIAALYQLINREHPTLIIDDADQLLPRKPELVHMLNASWTRDTSVVRGRSKGGAVKYDLFCGKILNGIYLEAHLKPATRSRCIIVDMLPALEHEQTVNYRQADADEEFITLQRKLLRWSQDHMPGLKKAQPDMPKGHINRQADNWWLLFAIADLAGGGWPKLARAAARAFMPEEEPSVGGRLLIAFYEMFQKLGKQISSDQVVAKLNADEEGEWASYHGRPINKQAVANLLKPYRIKPGWIYPKGKPQQRGYRAEWFETAFKHFLQDYLRQVGEKQKRQQAGCLTT
jgi:hypothetical protein